jgi:biopolymer transport protein ExbD
MMDAKMTPMIDVIFQLLIFFLCTAGFAIPEAVLPTELPREGGVAAAPPVPRDDADIVRIHLAGDDKMLLLRLNERPVADKQELFDQLRQIAAISVDAPVILDIQPGVVVGDLVSVYDGILASGLRSIHFATQSSSAVNFSEGE